MYQRIGAAVAKSAAVGGAVAGVMAVVTLAFPALIPLAAPLMMPLAVLGLCAVVGKVVRLGKEWYEFSQGLHIRQLPAGLPSSFCRLPRGPLRAGDRAVIATQSSCELSSSDERRAWRMASITIRNLDDDVKTRLRVRAADNGRSMEEEVRLILRDVVGRKPSSRNLTSIIRSHFGPANGVDLELPPREPGREPPCFDSDPQP